MWIGICYLWFKDFPDQFKIYIQKKEFIRPIAGIVHHTQYSLLQPSLNTTMCGWSWACILLSMGSVFFCGLDADLFTTGKGVYRDTIKTYYYFFIPGRNSGIFFGRLFFSEWIVKVRDAKVGRRITAFAACFFALYSPWLLLLKNDSLSSYSLMLSNLLLRLGYDLVCRLCRHRQNNTGTVTGLWILPDRWELFLCTLVWKNRWSNS